MIKFENIEIVGFEVALRGMRNPMNSWGRADSGYGCENSGTCEDCEELTLEWCVDAWRNIKLGENDKKLALNLAQAGTEHAKYRRMIAVYIDITAPLYWWKEFDTYKVGTVANSCSTMHKIDAKPFTLEDFSHEHLNTYSMLALENIIKHLNGDRLAYIEDHDKADWWQLIQLLPSSYNQKRTIMLNYEVLAAIYRQRKGHKLDEWQAFREMIEKLPNSKLITGGAEND